MRHVDQRLAEIKSGAPLLDWRARQRLAWLLQDYAELLESFAMGVDGGGPIDRDTHTRITEARAFAARFK